MNELIAKLYDQAIVIEDGGDYVCGELDPVKFAELIIGHATECVRDVLRDENSDLSYTAAGQVQNRIKEYFGVKEWMN